MPAATRRRTHRLDALPDRLGQFRRQIRAPGGFEAEFEQGEVGLATSDQPSHEFPEQLIPVEDLNGFLIDIIEMIPPSPECGREWVGIAPHRVSTVPSGRHRR